MSQASYNPADKNSLSGVIQEVLRNYSLSLENCIPAVVVSHDRATNTVIVQPAINSVLTDGTPQARDKIKLPIHIFGGGGVVISAPLNAGDTGWIIAGDRDISLFKQSLAISNPNTYRTHKFSFGFFIPDKIKGFSVQSGDEGAFLIQTLDGTTRIALSDGLIKVVSKSDVNVESPNLTITGQNVSITGTTTITGDLTVSGTITGQTDVIAAGISGKAHVHGGVTSGNATSGGPQ